MSISASSAFNMLASGSMSKATAKAYDQYMNNYYSEFSDMGGWFGNAMEEVKKEHNYFMNSRIWEFGNLLKNKDGFYVDKHEIGFLNGVEYQRQAEGMMRNIIMANPKMMSLYQEGRVSGYNDDFFKDVCSGVGRDNYYYNKVMDGYVNFDEETKVTTRSSYYTNRDERSSYTFKERRDSHRTWRSTNYHLTMGLDPSSIEGAEVLSVEDGLKWLSDKQNITLDE